MSEISSHNIEHLAILQNYMHGAIKGVPGAQLVKDTGILETSIVPVDILALFDSLFNDGYSVDDMKQSSNKLFNLLHKALDSLPSENIEPETIISYLIEDNKRLDTFIKENRKLFVTLNGKYGMKDRTALALFLLKLRDITKHYEIKENIIFPLIEKEWEHHQCVKLMWAFHDDIRKAIKEAMVLLKKRKVDVQAFNKITGKLFFNIYTILYREEKVLYPHLIQTIEAQRLKELVAESADLGYSYIKDREIVRPTMQDTQPFSKGEVHLSTGNLTIKQLELLFAYLPVDMTYVDGNDEVRFFSDPPHRIFPRSKAIIGRKVQNCHPPDSVDIVEKILDAFKDGSKNEASFWIQMGEKLVYIRYFAMRDAQGIYEGCLEVSQEVSEIQKLEGERRLLDWE